MPRSSAAGLDERSEFQNASKQSFEEPLLYQNIHEFKRSERYGKMHVYALRSVSGPLLDSADYTDSAHAEIRRNDRVSRLYFRITRRVCTRLSPAPPFN